VGEIRWSAEAEGWLEEIHDYIAQDNPDAALRTVQGP
jgi:toxin ParE1/3/4